MREVLDWARSRSVRRSAVVWGSAFALATGCVAAWGVGTPAPESGTTAPASSQTTTDGNGKAAENSDSRWDRNSDRWQGKSDWGKNSDSRWWDRWDRDDLGSHTPDPAPGDAVEEPDTTTPPPVETPDPAPVVPPVTEPAPPVTEPAPATPPAQTAGWPTAATTGLPAGVTLTPMNGLTVKTNGAVIDAKLVKGDIIINANNVTIKNSKVEGRIQIRPPYTGLMVQRTEIAGPGTAWAAVTEGIGYANFTCDGCNIHGWGKGAMMDANVTISNSWIHDMPVAPGSHNEAILSLGGPNYTIVNNRLDSGGAGNFTASLAFLNQWNSFTNTLVKGNLFNGGGYCVYAGGEKATNAKYPSSNVRFLDNTFGSDENPKCGYYGAAVAWDASGPGNQWSGNVMSDGTPVRTPSVG